MKLILTNEKEIVLNVVLLLQLYFYPYIILFLRMTTNFIKEYVFYSILVARNTFDLGKRDLKISVKNIKRFLLKYQNC